MGAIFFEKMYGKVKFDLNGSGSEDATLLTEATHARDIYLVVRIPAPSTQSVGWRGIFRDKKPPLAPSPFPNFFLYIRGSSVMMYEKI